MDLQFDSSRHTYTLDGQILPSVTQVVRAVLPGQFQAEPHHLERGTLVHELCQQFDENFLDWTAVPATVLGRVRAWQEFRSAAGLVPVLAEQPLASRTYRFAGTLDRLGSVPGVGLVVVDLKSTIEPRVRLQLGAYSLLACENGHGKPARAAAVELREDGSYRTLWLSPYELRLAEQQFLAALTVWNFQQQYMRSA